MPDDVTAETYEPCVGSRFLVHAGDEQVAVELTEVDRRREQPGAPREHPFSLWFRGPGDVLPQATYRVEHETLGDREMFLVPRQPLADGAARYEAMFN